MLGPRCAKTFGVRTSPTARTGHALCFRCMGLSRDRSGLSRAVMADRLGGRNRSYETHPAKAGAFRSPRGAAPARSRSMMPLFQTWRRFLPYLGGVAALLLFAAALFILHRHAQAYRPSEVRSALQTLQIWRPFAALGLAAASYSLLTLYDVLALRHVGRTLPYGGVALASCTAYAFSHAVGFGSIM